MIALLVEHTCHHQSVTAIIARTGKYHNTFAWAKSRGDFASHRRSSPLHQREAINTLLLNGISIYLPYFLGREYLHITSVVFPILIIIVIALILSQ